MSCSKLSLIGLAKLMEASVLAKHVRPMLTAGMTWGVGYHGFSVDGTESEEIFNLIGAPVPAATRKGNKGKPREFFVIDYTLNALEQALNEVDDAGILRALTFRYYGRETDERGALEGMEC